MRNDRGPRAAARRRLSLERLEQRQLLAADMYLLAASPFLEAEGEAAVTELTVEQVRVSPAPVSSIEVVFSSPPVIESMIADGTILDAVTLARLDDGAVGLTSDQFSFDANARTLTWSSSTDLAAGYYQLFLDGALLQDSSGHALHGGASGLTFNVPEFGAAQQVLASGSVIEVDNYSVPSLVDWNADQLVDLVVGEKTDAGEGKVRVYLNVGTNTSPEYGAFVYARQGDTELVVSASGCLGVFPRSFDWDGDGKKDLVLGLADGRVQVYGNTHTDAEPRFGEPRYVLVGEPGAKTELDVGARATLDMVDWNNDGRTDLVAGALDGKVRVYLNEADTGPADFRSPMVVQDAGGELSVPTARSSVAVADLDGDGRKDLLLGNTEGQLLFYANVGTDVEPAFAAGAPLLAGGAELNLEGIPRSRPFVGDYNADGRPDVLVGAQDGVVRLVEATQWLTPVLYAGEAGNAGERYTHTFASVEVVWQNPLDAMDVSGDGAVVPLDVLRIINELNLPVYHDDVGRLFVPPPDECPPPYLDVNGDGFCTPLDALAVINHLNAPDGEGEANDGWAKIVVHHARTNAGDTAVESPVTGAATASPPVDLRGILRLESQRPGRSARAEMADGDSSLEPLLALLAADRSRFLPAPPHIFTTLSGTI